MANRQPGHGRPPLPSSASHHLLPSQRKTFQNLVKKMKPNPPNPFVPVVDSSSNVLGAENLDVVQQFGGVTESENNDDFAVERHSQASQYRYIPIQHYDLLDNIFGKDIATGSHATGTNQRKLRWASQEDNTNIGGSSPSSENQDDSVGIEMTRHESNAKETSSFRGTIYGFSSKSAKEATKKRARVVDIVSEDMKLIRDGLIVVTAALDRENAQNFSAKQLEKAIYEVEGMSELSRMKVYQALTKNDSEA